MNITLWILAGAVLGWAGFAYLNANQGRGKIVSIIIGAVGGFFGGNVLAPVLGAVVSAQNEFSPFSLVVAAATAAACLTIANLLSNRYGI